MKLLYAEDEMALSEAVTDIFVYYNYTVEAVYDGEEAFARAEHGNYDGLILDIMLPKKDGLEVLRELRKGGCKTPVLLLTAKTGVEDRIYGLDLGADDYLPKPFHMGELLSRVRAMLRRRETFTPDILRCGNLSLDRRKYELENGGRRRVLSKLEYQVMELLMLNQGNYLSTEDILIKIWGYETEADVGVVWVYLSYLRKKLAALHADVEIHAKRNIGYTLAGIANRRPV